MSILSGFPKGLKIMFVISLIVVILLSVIDWTLSSRTVSNVSVTLESNDDMARTKFLSDYGWTVTTSPIEVCEVTLPNDFDSVWQCYNDLQKNQNFDLSEFRGKRVKRYTYSVINYPDGVEGVRANILQCDDKIIGGDICTVAIDGFIHGFSQDGCTGIMKQTLATEDMTAYETFAQSVGVLSE